MFVLWHYSGVESTHNPDVWIIIPSRCSCSYSIFVYVLWYRICDCFIPSGFLLIITMFSFVVTQSRYICWDTIQDSKLSDSVYAFYSPNVLCYTIHLFVLWCHPCDFVVIRPREFVLKEHSTSYEITTQDCLHERIVAGHKISKYFARESLRYWS
jgi:hypothetical protein